MSMKKELHKVMGTGDSIERRMERTGLSRIELNQHDDRFSKITYKTKAKPRSSWYPETKDMEVKGRKS